MHACMCIYVCVCLPAALYLHVSTCAHVYVFECFHVSIHMDVCTHVYEYVGMCTHINVCVIYMHTYMYMQGMHAHTPLVHHLLMRCI